jgi:hypothetical protein
MELHGVKNSARLFLFLQLGRRVFNCAPPLIHLFSSQITGRRTYSYNTPFSTQTAAAAGNECIKKFFVSAFTLKA